MECLCEQWWVYSHQGSKYNEIQEAMSFTNAVQQKWDFRPFPSSNLKIQKKCSKINARCHFCSINKYFMKFKFIKNSGIPR